MRVLILSCDTGGGHNSCAAAIRQIFAENGHYCNVADALGFVSNKLSKFMSWGHTAMYRYVPGLFRAGYEFSEKNSSILEDDTIVYKLLTDGTEQLYDYLKNGEYDTVICTHVFSGLLLRQTMKEYPMQLVTAFVATDYTCSPGAANSDLDYYFIPSASLEEDFVSQGVSKEKIIPTGIPVRQEFYNRGNKAKAKRKLGIDPNHPHLLMMCGSMGCGPLKKLTKLLHGQMDSGMELSVVCGTNENLRAELAEHFGAEINIHIHGFVHDMSAMLDSADLCLTKPGGLSTTEAAVKGLPMVFIDAVAGCEEYNLEYFVSLGGAVTADKPEELARLCIELLRSRALLAEMQDALERLPHQNAAMRICEVMCGENTRLWQKDM